MTITKKYNQKSDIFFLQVCGLRINSYIAQEILNLFDLKNIIVYIEYLSEESELFNLLNRKKIAYYKEMSKEFKGTFLVIPYDDFGDLITEINIFNDNDVIIIQAIDNSLFNNKKKFIELMNFQKNEYFWGNCSIEIDDYESRIKIYIRNKAYNFESVYKNLKNILK